MDKRFSQRKSGKFLAAAVATVGMAGLSHQADGSLLIDVRAIGAIVGSGASISNGGKTVTATPGSQITVTMGVFARITGTNGVQSVGEFGGGGGDDIRNDDSVQAVVGSFQSVGSLLGNLTTGAAGQVTPNPRQAPFGASGSSNGIASDFDSDGDLDIGSLGTDPANMFVGRAGSPTHATIWGPGAVNFSPGGKGFSVDDSSASGNNANDTIIDANTQEVQIGSLRYVTNGTTGSSTLVNFLPRPTTDAGSASWFEDSSPTAKSPGSSAYTTGTPINVQLVPEPATLGLLGIAGLGLLARRRNRDENA